METSHFIYDKADPILGSSCRSSRAAHHVRAPVGPAFHPLPRHRAARGGGPAAGAGACRARGVAGGRAGGLVGARRSTGAHLPAAGAGRHRRARRAAGPADDGPGPPGRGEGRRELAAHRHAAVLHPGHGRRGPVRRTVSRRGLAAGPGGGARHDAGDGRGGAGGRAGGPLRAAPGAFACHARRLARAQADHPDPRPAARCPRSAWPPPSPFTWRRNASTRSAPACCSRRW